MIDLTGVNAGLLDSRPRVCILHFLIQCLNPHSRFNRTRSCNITVRTSPLPHANDCPQRSPSHHSNNHTHLTDLCRTQPWSYGPENFIILKKVSSFLLLLPPRTNLDNVRQYIALRYQLIPYVKKLFQDLQKTGRVIMRGLYLDFSLSDDFVVKATQANNPVVIHQFMFGTSFRKPSSDINKHLIGPRILVAPVGELGATTKDVYLPKLGKAQKGMSWKHWCVFLPS